MCAGPCSPPAVPWKWQGLCFSSLQDQVKSITIYYSYASAVTSVKAPISSEKRGEKEPALNFGSSSLCKKYRKWVTLLFSETQALISQLVLETLCTRSTYCVRTNNLTMISKMKVELQYISGFFHGAKLPRAARISHFFDDKLGPLFAWWLQPHWDCSIFTKIIRTGRVDGFFLMADGSTLFPLTISRVDGKEWWRPVHV